MADSLDIAALRRQSLEGFATAARTYFAAHREAQSMVLAVSQYFADEAGDAVHEHLYAFPSREPWWPHRCAHDDADGDAADGSKCSSCAWDDMPRGTLDSNTEAVFAWSAFCTEWGGGEGDPSLGAPVAIARRAADDGEVELELVYEVVRPWMDTNDAASLRDEENWDEDPLPPAPEPVRPPWTPEERRLLDAVLASPRDDGPRRVLVDAWLERGDVRGEFGALSFDEPKTRAERARRDALADEHGRAWLGPLQPFITVGAARFGRGPFVRSAVVSWNAEDAHPEAVEEWALLEELRFAGERHPVSRHMRGLVRAFGLTASTISAMTEAGLEAPLEVVGLAETVSAQTWGACPALRGVKHLVLEGGDDVRELAALPCWSALESVEAWLPAPGGDFEAPRAWSDERGVSAIRALRPVLGANTRLVVGYQLENGANGGVVAVVTREGVSLEDRRFASDEARQAARERLERLELSAPAATPAAAVAEAKPGEPRKPGFFSRLFGQK